MWATLRCLPRATHVFTQLRMSFNLPDLTSSPQWPGPDIMSTGQTFIIPQPSEGAGRLSICWALHVKERCEWRSVRRRICQTRLGTFIRILLLLSARRKPHLVHWQSCSTKVYFLPQTLQRKNKCLKNVQVSDNSMCYCNLLIGIWNCFSKFDSCSRF